MADAHDQKYVGAVVSILFIVWLASIFAPRRPPPKITHHSYEHHLYANQVDANGVVIEFRPTNASIGKEYHSDNDRVVVTSGTTVVAIEGGKLSVNAVEFGMVNQGDHVLIENGVVYVNDQERENPNN